MSYVRKFTVGERCKILVTMKAKFQGAYVQVREKECFTDLLIWKNAESTVTAYHKYLICCETLVIVEI